MRLSRAPRLGTDRVGGEGEVRGALGKAAPVGPMVCEHAQDWSLGTTHECEGYRMERTATTRCGRGNVGRRMVLL